MTNEIKGGRIPPGMSDEMKLAVDYLAGVNEIVKGVEERRKKQSPIGDPVTDSSSKDKPSDKAVEEHE
jgi:hypothetical protein